MKYIDKCEQVYNGILLSVLEGCGIGLLLTETGYEC